MKFDIPKPVDLFKTSFQLTASLHNFKSLTISLEQRLCATTSIQSHPWSLSGDKLKFYIPVFYFDLNRDWNRTDQSLFSLISTWSFPAWLAIEGLSLLVLTRGYLFHEYRDGDPRERNQPWECELYVIWRVPAAVMDPDQDIKMDFVDFPALRSLPPLNYGITNGECTIAERIYYFYRGVPSVA